MKGGQEEAGIEEFGLFCRIEVTGGDAMELPKRKPIRLKEYDYSGNAAFFVTVCVSNRSACLWNNAGADNTHSGHFIRPQYDIQSDKPLPLSAYGKIVEEAVNNVHLHYPNVEVNQYCIMPDHIHMIVFISDVNGRIISAPTTATLSTVVGQMKRWASKQIGFPLWQKSFYDRIIRNEREYQEVWRYISENPLKWREDTIKQM